MMWLQILMVIGLVHLGQTQSCENGVCEQQDDVMSQPGSVMLQTQRHKSGTDAPQPLALSTDAIDAIDAKIDANAESDDAAAPSRTIIHGESDDVSAPSRAVIHGEGAEEQTTITRDKSYDAAEEGNGGQSEDGAENKESMTFQKSLDQQCAKDQPLTEEGWTNIQSHCCLYLLDTFSRRIIMDLKLDVCEEGCHNGFFPYFHCQPDSTLEAYKAAIFANQAEDCWCFAPEGECGTKSPGRNCTKQEGPIGPINPAWHRRRRCGTAETTTTTTVYLAPGVTTTPGIVTTTTTIPSADRLCSLPPEVHDYSLITLNDATVNAHEIYKGLAIGGTLKDGTPSETTAIGGASFANKVRTPGNWNFKGGITTDKALKDVFDWSHFEWLARNAVWVAEGGYKVRVFQEGGTYSADGQPAWGLDFDGQGEDNGRNLMIFKTNEDIRLIGSKKGRQYGPSVLAPFSVVTLDGSAGFADGFIIAKQFGPSGTYPSAGRNAGALQLHGDGYTGPMECKDGGAFR